MKIMVLVDGMTVWDAESNKRDVVELAIDGTKVTINKPQPRKKKARRKPVKKEDVRVTGSKLKTKNITEPR
jgi:hypothetical protein